MKVLTIDRATWGRGNAGSSFLLHGTSRRMCCLGFYALQHTGAVENEITDQETPEQIKHLPWGSELTGEGGHTSLCVDLMHYNDAADMPESDRERTITKLFASMDVRVEFVG